MAPIRPTQLAPQKAAQATPAKAQPSTGRSFSAILEKAQQTRPEEPAQAAAGQPVTAEEKAEALRQIARDQGLMMSQSILAMAGSGPKLDRE